MGNHRKKHSEFFEEISASIRVGIKAERGGKILTRHEVNIPGPPKKMSAQEIKKLREKQFKVSQHVFAVMLNVSSRTVQAWERNVNQPNGSSLRLLHLARNHPQHFLNMLNS